MATVRLGRWAPRMCAVTVPLHSLYMNWLDSRSRVDEVVTVGSCRINHLLFADNLELFLNFCAKQHTLDRFADACDYAGNER